MSFWNMCGHSIPKIHDWSVNDCFCATLKIAQKHREKVWNYLMPYAKSDQEFEQRVVAVMLMESFPDRGIHCPRVLAVWDRLDHPGYYRKMGVAWGVAKLRIQNTQRKHMHFYWRIIWMTKHTIRRSRK